MQHCHVPDETEEAPSIPYVAHGCATAKQWLAWLWACTKGSPTESCAFVLCGMCVCTGPQYNASVTFSHWTVWGCFSGLNTKREREKQWERETERERGREREKLQALGEWCRKPRLKNVCVSARAPVRTMRARPSDRLSVSVLFCTSECGFVP